MARTKQGHDRPPESTTHHHTLTADVASGARNSSSSLRRSLKILAYVANAQADARSVGLKEISEGLGINRSTILRLVAPLLEERMLAHDSESGHYKLGAWTAYLGHVYLEDLSIPTVARHLLEALTEGCNEATHLVILDGLEVVYIDKVESKQAVRMYSRVGNRQPAYCTGVGKAYLAYADNEIVQRVLANGLAPRTPQTITSERAFVQELQDIRSRGYAVDDIENEPDIRCIAAPVFDHRDAVVAAISVSGPSNRVTLERVSEIARSVVSTAYEISLRLGAPPAAAAARYGWTSADCPHT